MRTGTILLCAFGALTAGILRAIDLSDYLVATGLMAATPRIRVCESASHTSVPVAAMAQNKAKAVQAMAALIHTKASRGDCGLTAGSISGISFRHASIGGTCHTATRLDYIETALKKALNMPGKGFIQTTMCLRLNDDGPWKSFLAYGRFDVFDDTTTCDDTLNFSECLEGDQGYPRGVSDTNSTAVSSGSFQQIAYAYHAAGPNCATMSEVGSVDFALSQRFSKLDAKSTEKPVCVRFDEGGPWNGWLLYGRLGEMEPTAYCGPTLEDCRTCH